MSANFRKSLFGFNCEDVISYIDKTHQSYSAKESEFKSEIADLNDNLNLLNNELNALRLANSRLEQDLKDYNDKYDEIERLSQNIGKLYLVAQANARAVMENSAEAERISREETEKNISVLSDAHSSLDELKANLLRASSDFASQVDELLNSLNTAKERINECNDNGKEMTEKFDTMYAELSK